MTFLLPEGDKPSWFDYPDEFQLVLQLGLVDLGAWVILQSDAVRKLRGELEERYPDRELFPFARRRGTHDLACWSRGNSLKIVVIHIGASAGWEKRAEFDTFWEWFHYAVDELTRYVP